MLKWETRFISSYLLTLSRLRPYQKKFPRFHWCGPWWSILIAPNMYWQKFTIEKQCWNQELVFSHGVPPGMSKVSQLNWLKEIEVHFSMYKAFVCKILVSHVWRYILMKNCWITLIMRYYSFYDLIWFVMMFFMILLFEKKHFNKKMVTIAYKTTIQFLIIRY